MAQSSKADANAVEISKQDHQKFNQFLRYQVAHTESKKHLDCKQLAALYERCDSTEARKGFIARWLRSGGAKGDIKVMVEQEMRFLNQKTQGKKSGMLTPGQIGTLVSVHRSSYSSDAEYESALKWFISKNQQEHPPPGPSVEEGMDFHTSLYFFTSKDMDEDKTTTSSYQKINKNLEILGSASTSASVAVQMLDTDNSEPTTAVEDKRPTKEQLLLGKKAEASSQAICQSGEPDGQSKKHAALEELGGLCGH